MDSEKIFEITKRTDTERMKQMFREKFSELLFKELFDEEATRVLENKIQEIKDDRFALTHEQNKLEVRLSSVMVVVYFSSLFFFCLIFVPLGTKTPSTSKTISFVSLILSFVSSSISFILYTSLFLLQVQMNFVLYRRLH